MVGISAGSNITLLENTAVARNQLSVILDALISFDCGCRKVSDHGDQRADTADDGVFHHAALCRSRIDDAEQNRSDDTADSVIFTAPIIYFLSVLLIH